MPAINLHQRQCKPYMRAPFQLPGHASGTNFSSVQAGALAPMQTLYKQVCLGLQACNRGHGPLVR